MITLPAGLIAIYGAQLFITLGFSLLFSSLAFYFTEAFHLSQAKSCALIGLFIAGNFAVRLISGYLGGNFLSKRVLFLICNGMQLLGVYQLAMADERSLYIGLSAFLIGSGMNYTCLQCLLTEKFERNDDKREYAFFLNYIVINAGYLIGFTCSGFFEFQKNYSSLFYICLITTILSFGIFLNGWKHFSDKIYDPIRQTSSWLKACIGIIIVIALLPTLYIAFHYARISNNLIIVISFILFLMVGRMAYNMPSGLDKNNLSAFLILTLFSIVFWALFFVGPMGFAWFLKYNTNTWFYGMQIPPQWIMNLNAFFVILGAPICIYVLQYLRAKGYRISVPLQFWLSILFIALSFFVLSIGIYYADSSGLSNMTWIIAHFLLQAIGELLIAPVGYAMVGKLIMPKYQGLMMGIWMMVVGIAATISRHFSTLMTQTESLDPLISNPTYAFNFNVLGLLGIIAAIFLYFLIPILEKILKVEETMPVAESTPMTLN